MEFELKQVLTKTPQGINATRSGDGLSAKSHAVLRAFDGSKAVFDLRKICLSASLAEADFNAALQELKRFEYIRTVDAVSEAKAKADIEAERKMLMTLDFTALDDALPPPSAAPAKPAASAPARPPSVNAAVVAAAVQARARQETAARLKLETEIRQKLVVALQIRVEEDLRAQLGPKLEAELRPKLIAALRPGIEAELRTALTAELTPRIALELKARFAKTLAAQRATDPQAVVTEAVVATAPAVATVVTVPTAGAENGFERVLASMTMPVFSADTRGVCTYLSPAWAQFSGYTASEVVGKPLVDFFAEADRRALASLLRGIASGNALRFEQQGALTRKDGTALWTEISAAPLYSATGEPIGVCGTMRDAAEARRVAEQAEADGVRLLLLVDQIDTGVLLEDGEGNIQQVNAALCTLLSLDAAPYSLEGMAVGEFLERASSGFIGPAGFLHRIAQIRSTGKDVKAESFVMADGRVIVHDYLAVTVNDDVAGRVWLLREVPRAQSRPAA